MMETFPNFMGTLHSKIQEAQQTPTTRKMKKYTTVELLKTSDKQKNLKVSRLQRYIAYREIKIKMTAKSSSEIVETRNRSTSSVEY